MSPEELKQRLPGVLVFAITPFDERTLEVDFDGFRRNLEFLTAGGINAVSVAGFVGEFSALTAAEYSALVRTARAVLGPDRLLVAGVGFGTAVAAEYAAAAEAADADCAMLLPPYLVAPTEDGMVAHVQQVADATRLGLMVHSMAGHVFTPRLVERFAEIPSVVSYKDELGNVAAFVEIADRVGDRLVYVNGRAEPMMGFYAAAGMTVLASAIGNFDPAIALEAYAVAQELDFERLRAILAPRATPWYQIREHNRDQAISVSKSTLNMLGLAGGLVRPPLSNLGPELESELRDVLAVTGYLELVR